MSDVIWFGLYLCSVSGVFGMEYKLVNEGDPVTLSVEIDEKQRIEGISWKFGAQGYLIAEISRLHGDAKIYEDQAHGRFRDRLKLDQTGSLTITNIIANNSGLYEVSDTNTNAQLELFNVTVCDCLPSPIISGFTFTYKVAAFCVGSLIVFSLIIFIYVKCKKTQQQQGK